MYSDDHVVIRELSENVRKIATAITPLDAASGHDESGGTVASLTEAVMGITAGLMAVASSIESLADVVRERPIGAE